MIAGMDAAERHALLDAAFYFIGRPEFSYVHEWQKGDVLMWDNRSSMHARRDFPADQIRLMWRTTLEGESRPEYRA